MIHIYHPNKAVKGFATSFWYSERDDTIFATLIKQSGWDDVKQNGIFKGSIDDPNKKVNIKLEYTEISAILDCIDRGRPFTNFHDNDEFKKSISFTPWMGQDNAGVAVQRGFSFSVTVQSKQDSTFKNSFYIGLTYAEARLIREFLIFTLHSHFARLRVPQTPIKTPAMPVAIETPQVEQEPEPEVEQQEPISQVDPLLDF